MPLKPFPFPINVGTDICSVHRIFQLLAQGSRTQSTRFVARISDPLEAADFLRSGFYKQPLKEWWNLQSKRKALGFGSRKYPPVKVARSIEEPAAINTRDWLRGLRSPAKPDVGEHNDGESADAREYNDRSVKTGDDAANSDYVQAAGSEETNRTLNQELQQIDDELDAAYPRMRRIARFFAGRWAAKEAIIKAHESRRLTFHDIRIPKRLDEGTVSMKPIARVRPESGDWDNAQIVPLSISHDGSYAIATCMAYEASPGAIFETADDVAEAIAVSEEDPEYVGAQNYDVAEVTSLPAENQEPRAGAQECLEGGYGLYRSSVLYRHSVVINNIPSESSEHELKSWLGISNVPIEFLRAPDLEGGSSKSALLQFKTFNYASSFVHRTNNLMLNGLRIECRFKTPSMANELLFVKIKKAPTFDPWSDELTKLQRQTLFPKFKEVFVKETSSASDDPPKELLLYFDSPKEQSRYLETWNNTCLNGHRIECRVKSYDPESLVVVDFDQSIRELIKTIYQLLQDATRPPPVYILPRIPFSKRSAILYFDTPEEALKAVQILNTADLPGTPFFCRQASVVSPDGLSSPLKESEARGFISNEKPSENDGQDQSTEVESNIVIAELPHSYTDSFVNEIREVSGISFELDCPGSKWTADHLIATFLTFKTSEDASKFVHVMNNATVEGQQIQCRLEHEAGQVSPRFVLVKNVPHGASSQELFELLNGLSRTERLRPIYFWKQPLLNSRVQRFGRILHVYCFNEEDARDLVRKADNASIAGSNIRCQLGSEHCQLVSSPASEENVREENAIERHPNDGDAGREDYSEETRAENVTEELAIEQNADRAYSQEKKPHDEAFL